VRPPVERLRLPQARAVEVQRDAVLARPVRLRHEVFPFGQEPSDLPLRQLEEQRCDRLPQRFEVSELDQPVRVADERPVQAVEALVALLLVELEMARGMERDRRAGAALAPDPQRDLLRHRPARHEDRGLLAEEVRNAALEAPQPLALAVAVRALRVVGGRRQGVEALPHGGRAVPGVEEALRPRDRCARSLLVVGGYRRVAQ
jgi:hypothetical protein